MPFTYNNFIFQQDSAPAHRARDTIALLRRETPNFYFSRPVAPKQPIYFNPVDYKIWAVMQERVYEKRVYKRCRRAVSASVECVAQH